MGLNTKAMDKWKIVAKANNPFTQQTFEQVTEQAANATATADNKINTTMDQGMIDYLLGKDKHRDMIDTFTQEYMLPVGQGTIGDATAQTKSTIEECLEEVLGQELAMSLVRESIENKIEPVILLMWIIDNHYNPIE